MAYIDKQMEVSDLNNEQAVQRLTGVLRGLCLRQTLMLSMNHPLTRGDEELLCRPYGIEIIQCMAWNGEYNYLLCKQTVTLAA